MNTRVINLLAGAGCGKSTIASGLFYNLRRKGHSAELVTEVVKEWAWLNRKVGPLDQLYLLGSQAHKESDLYGKVSTIITDSPLILCGVYDTIYNSHPYIMPCVTAHLEAVKKYNNVNHVYYQLKRNPSFYEASGRQQDLKEATRVDKEIRRLCKAAGIQVKQLSSIALEEQLREIEWEEHDARR